MGKSETLKCSGGAKGQINHWKLRCLPSSAATPGIFTWKRQGIFTSNPQIVQIQFHSCTGDLLLNDVNLSSILLLIKWQEANFGQKIFNSSKFSWHLFRATKGLSSGNHLLLVPKASMESERLWWKEGFLIFTPALLEECNYWNISNNIDKTPF